jgi:hypothetical protein
MRIQSPDRRSPTLRSDVVGWKPDQGVRSRSDCDCAHACEGTRDVNGSHWVTPPRCYRCPCMSCRAIGTQPEVQAFAMNHSVVGWNRCATPLMGCGTVMASQDPATARHLRSGRVRDPALDMGGAMRARRLGVRRGILLDKMDRESESRELVGRMLGKSVRICSDGNGLNVEGARSSTKRGASSFSFAS